jgi:alcohol dehydrogenase
MPPTAPTTLAAAPTGFDHQPRTRLVFGAGTVSRTGEFAKSWGSKRALLVTDRHIAAVGHAALARKSLEAAGIHVTVFDGVRENPTTQDVDNCLAVARPANVDTLVAVGGGSSMDTAKGCNFILTGGGVMQDYWGIGKARGPMLPLIAVPTTGGTGSECQSFALIADAESHNKMACGDPRAAARVAILDPALTLTQPPLVTANTGIDALTHAIETAVTTRRNDLSLMYSRESFRLIAVNFERVIGQPDDLEARGRMLLAAAYAGTAIENSMLGAAHAAANPLTARFGITHGQAVGLMMPHVVRFNAADDTARHLYADLAIQGRLIGPGSPVSDPVDAIIDLINHLLTISGLKRSLRDFELAPGAIPALADDAAKQWTAQFNPRPLTAADFAALYESALAAR